jgi:NAD+ kinase
MTLAVAVRGDRDRGEAIGSPPVGVTVVDREDRADLLVVVGAAFGTLADDAAPVPVLPVDAGVGRDDRPAERLESALAALARDPGGIESRTVRYPIVAVGVDGGEARAVRDVTLVASEPAHISEYAVADATGPLASCRADGVVVATPAGSVGYSHAVGGPILSPGAGLGVVPISPYTTRPRTWVVDAPVTLRVERDETPVSLVVDGTERRRVAVGDPVRVDVAGTLAVVQSRASESQGTR